jgi:hypothetical protein
MWRSIITKNKKDRRGGLSNILLEQIGSLVADHALSSSASAFSAALCSGAGSHGNGNCSYEYEC